MESTDSENGSLVLNGNGDAFVSEVIHFLSEKRIKVTSFRTEEPNLEDVFLKLTGRSIRD